MGPLKKSELLGKIKIQTRLGVGFTIVVLSTFLLGIFAFFQINIIFENTQKLYDHPLQVSTAALTANGNIIAMHRSMKDVVLAKNTVDIEKASAVVNEYEQEVIKQFDIIRERFLGDKSQVNEVFQTFLDWKDIRDGVIRSLKAGNVDEASRITREQGANHVQKMASQMAGLIDFAKAKSVIFMTGASATKDRAQFWTIFAIVSLSLLSGLIAYIISRSITVPVSQLSATMDSLAKGNNDIEIPHSDRGDEIGTMANAVEGFKQSALERIRLEKANREAEQAELVRQDAEKQAAISREKAEAEREKTVMAEREARASRVSGLISNFDRKVTEMLDVMALSSTEMSATARQLVMTSSDTKERSAAVSSASDETANNVNMVASAAEELSSSVQEISRQVKEASKTSLEAVQEAQQSATAISALSEASEKINDVIGIISDIAEQTNLLALNATIESARAGEAGKGFAVVATEVKALAGQTGNATEEIAAQIKAMQSLTQEAVNSIQVIVDVNHKSNETTNNILSSVEEQGLAANEISQNIQQVATGTSEVSSNTTRVAAGADETGMAGEQVLLVADDLGKISENLKRDIEQFLSDVRAA